MDHTQAEPAIPKQFRIATEVLSEICQTIGMRKAETGGILGGKRDTGEVTHFCYDAEATQSSVVYTPNNTYLNAVKREWQSQGIDYLGSVHSHPPYIRHPSMGDEEYIKRILGVLEVPYMLAPIVTTIPDTGSFSLYPFIAAISGGKLWIVEQELVVGGNLIQPAQKRQYMPDVGEGITALVTTPLCFRGGFSAQPFVSHDTIRETESRAEGPVRAAIRTSW